MRVVEGEGAVFVPGSKSSRPLAVEVTDETGKPVEAAAVSFHMPYEGPTGLFANGLRTTILQTDAHGRAAVQGIQVNRVPGRLMVRIVASKDNARVGALCFQYIAEPKSAGTAKVRGRRSRWVAVFAVLGGGAAAGYYAVSRAGLSTPVSAAPPTLTIGAPTITVGKP